MEQVVVKGKRKEIEGIGNYNFNKRSMIEREWIADGSKRENARELQQKY